MSLIKDYANLALLHGNDLINEAFNKDYDPKVNFAEQNPFTEVDIFSERARLIAEVAAAVVLSDDPQTIDEVFGAKIISGSFMRGSLWGQFPVPSIIVRYLAWRSLDASAAPDLSLVSLLTGYTMAAANHSLPNQITNAAPYYTYEEVLFTLSGGKFGIDSDVTLDNTKNQMSFGLSIMQMLALRNMKQSCKSLWGQFSKMLHGSTEVDLSDYFSPRPSVTGKTTAKQLYAKNWVDLVNEAVDDSASTKLEKFHGLNWLAAAYLCIAPHRAEHNVLMALQAAVSSTWYCHTHRPGDPII